MGQATFQQLAHLLGRAEAAGRVLFQQTLDDRYEPRRQLGIERRMAGGGSSISRRSVAIVESARNGETPLAIS